MSSEKDTTHDKPSGGEYAILQSYPHFRRRDTGKRALNLKTVRKDGAYCERSRIILRRMLPISFISVLIPMVGILAQYVDTLCIFRSSRYTLHDDIADTKVIDLRLGGAHLNNGF